MQPSTYSSTLQAAHTSEASSSGVSWGAVIGGAVVAAALALVLLALGAGLGLSSVSPWSNAGASSKTIGIATIVWLALMQIVASGMGGYLAGRLRTKWVDVHTDEVVLSRHRTRISGLGGRPRHHRVSFSRLQPLRW